MTGRNPFTLTVGPPKRRGADRPAKQAPRGPYRDRAEGSGDDPVNHTDLGAAIGYERLTSILPTMIGQW